MGQRQLLLQGDKNLQTICLQLWPPLSWRHKQPPLTECIRKRGQDKMNMSTAFVDWPTYLMLLFLQDKNYIPWLDSRCLVSLPSKGNFLAVLHAFIHMYLQNLHLLHHLLAFTFFTAVFLTDNFTQNKMEKKRWMETLLHTQETLEYGLGQCSPYLPHYSRCTQTASVGPFLGPVV